MGLPCSVVCGNCHGQFSFTATIINKVRYKALMQTITIKKLIQHNTIEKVKNWFKKKIKMVRKHKLDLQGHNVKKNMPCTVPQWGLGNVCINNK